MRAVLLLLFVGPLIPAGAAGQVFDGSWQAPERSALAVHRINIFRDTVRLLVACGAGSCDLGPTAGTVYRTVEPARTPPGGRGRVAVERPRPVELMATFGTAFRSIIVVLAVPEGRVPGRRVRVIVYSRDHRTGRAMREEAVFGERLVPRAAPLAGRLPQLPLPLPRASVRNVLPAGLATFGSGDSLGTVYDRLTSALNHAEIPSWSVYGIGDTGFGIVSQAERIADDGSALDAARRWPPALAEVDPPGAAGGFVDYLRRLFLGSPPGRYRVIVFAVTDQVLEMGVRPPDPAFMDSLVFSGGTILPSALRNRVLGADGRCEVFVYEFVRASPDDAPRLVTPSAMPIQAHLVGAGLWTREELRR